MSNGESGPPPYVEELDTVQAEISFLKRRAWEARNPTEKYNHYVDLITAGLQVVGVGEVASCPKCGWKSDAVAFRREVKTRLDDLDLNESWFKTLLEREYPVDVIFQLHYAKRLNNVMAIWDDVAVELVPLGIIRDKSVDEDDAVEEAIESLVMRGQQGEPEREAEEEEEEAPRRRVIKSDERHGGRR